MDRDRGAEISYYSMITRCLNPNRNHSYYGVVSVYPEWIGPGGVDRFVKYMGPRPSGTTIDRIDVYGHYVPGNVRWADNKTQQNNRRDNYRITVYDQVLTAQEFADYLKMPRPTLYKYLRMGWSTEHIILAQSWR